jgi:hypothetical protein
VLHDVHQEQRVALCALVHDGREAGLHLSPQAADQIGRHVHAGEQLQAQFHRLPLQATLNNVAVLGLLMFGWDHHPLTGLRCFDRTTSAQRNDQHGGLSTDEPGGPSVAGRLATFEKREQTQK